VDRLAADEWPHGPASVPAARCASSQPTAAAPLTLGQLAVDLHDIDGVLHVDGAADVVYVPGVPRETSLPVSVVEEPLVFGLLPSSLVAVIACITMLVSVLVLARAPTRLAGYLEALATGQADRRKVEDAR
jgi:hypothetical protein